MPLQGKDSNRVILRHQSFWILAVALILLAVTAQPDCDELSRPPTLNISSNTNIQVRLKSTIPAYAESSSQYPILQELQHVSELSTDLFQKMESDLASSIKTVSDKLLSRLACDLSDESLYSHDQTQSSHIAEIIYPIKKFLGDIVLYSQRLDEVYDARIAACVRLEEAYKQERRTLLTSFTIESIWAKSPQRWTGVGAKRRMQERLDKIYDQIDEVKSGKLVLTMTKHLLEKQLEGSQGLQIEVQKLPSRFEEEDPSMYETWPKDWFWDHVALYLVTENQIPLTQSQFDSWWENLIYQCPRSASQQTQSHEPLAGIVWFCLATKQVLLEWVETIKQGIQTFSDAELNTSHPSPLDTDPAASLE